MVVLCLDYGERYVGVAITDREGRIALRQGTIDQKQQDVAAAVREIVSSEQAATVLVGVPVGLSGQETNQTHVSLAFIEKLRGELGADVTIEGVDETLTSVEAERSIRREGGKAEDAHAEAARLMLAAYLRNY
jgi:putative holliday junction resolvase